MLGYSLSQLYKPWQTVLNIKESQPLFPTNLGLRLEAKAYEHVPFTIKIKKAPNPHSGRFSAGLAMPKAIGISDMVPECHSTRLT